MTAIRALTFDTGGTLLDWHSGFRDAFAAIGRLRGVERDWPALANDLRRRSLGAMLNLGQNGPPDYNFDQAHRFSLDALLKDEGLDAFTPADRTAIAWDTPHTFQCWPDCRDGLAMIRQRHFAVSFTILSYRMIIETARINGLTWDAVLSCEGFGVYKLLPEAYEKAAFYLQLKPSECMMVACHSFDLDAACAVGFRTALVHRPLEWGGDDPQIGSKPDPAAYDVVADDFIALAEKLA